MVFTQLLQIQISSQNHHRQRRHEAVAGPGTGETDHQQNEGPKIGIDHTAWDEKVMIGEGEEIPQDEGEDLGKKEKEEKGHLEGVHLVLVGGEVPILVVDKDLLQEVLEDHLQLHREGLLPQDKEEEVLQLKGGHLQQDKEEDLLEVLQGDHLLVEQELEAHWGDLELDQQEAIGGDHQGLGPEQDPLLKEEDEFPLEE